MNVRVSFLFVILLLNLIRNSNGNPGPCHYDLNRNGIINLTYVGNTDGTPKWKNVKPSIDDGHVYSYNPCQAFTEGESCQNVAACQVYAADESHSYSLGGQNSIQWHSTGPDTPPYIFYSSGERNTQINLRCIESGDDTLDVTGQNSTTGSYVMTLSSICICWDVCKDGRPAPAGSNPISIGMIFLIILVACLFIYFIAFMLLNKFKNNATGLNILPHRTFWISLPIYAVGGLRFTFAKITRKSTYQSV